MARDVDPVLEGLTEKQLKDLIISSVKEIQRLKEDAKVYSKGARETIKFLDDRNTDAMYLLEKQGAEQTQ